MFFIQHRFHLSGMLLCILGHFARMHINVMPYLIDIISLNDKLVLKMFNTGFLHYSSLRSHQAAF